MADVKSKPRRDLDTEPVSNLSSLDLPAPARYLISVAMTAVATALAVGIDSRVTIPNLSLVFVVPVVMAAIGLGLGPSLCSAVLGALAYNFFLTEPRYTFNVDDPANVWAIGLLFVIGLIVSGVAFTSHRKAAEAALLRRQATLLQDYSREVTAADNAKAMASATSRILAALFGVPAVVFLILDGKVVSVERVGVAAPQQAEVEAALSSLATGSVARAGVYPASTSRFDFWPVTTTASAPAAVIGLLFDPDERPLAPSISIEIVARLLSLALDRQHLLAGH
ncbi:MAG: DUF4118 domain-containing protein [Hyphomicrobiales bacterium]|nr:MAG: DUF4118 domain-containing protein [Hyphomicrobiales bacterium]